MTTPPAHRLRRILWSPFVGFVTLVYIVEEWLWDRLKAVMRAFGRLPGIRRLEVWISRLPPAGAAVFFVLPSTLVLPVKLVAIALIARGEVVRGTLFIVAAKIVATALFAWIYALTQPALMRVHWFVALREAILRWRAWAYRQIESHPLWRAIRRSIARWRAGREIKAGRWTRRWRAMQRLDRMRRRDCQEVARASSPVSNPLPVPPPRAARERENDRPLRGR